MCEVAWVSNAGGVGQVAHERADRSEGFQGSSAYRRRLVVCLGQGVDEEAALERLLVKPVVEGFEDHEQLFLGCFAAPLDFSLEPVPRPEIRVALDDRHDEPFL